MTSDPVLLGRAPAARTFELDDLQVLRAEQGGDGRTVRAYCAVYERPVVVTEPWGEIYEEIIRGGAFRKTIAEMRTSFQVLYNHGRTLHGTPAERYSMPIGTPIEVKEDSKGVLTTTRYAKTPLADEVLALIDNQSIRGQSFYGEWIQSRLIRAGGPGGLDRVERLEVAMKEYGPTPFPVYETAKILSVRSQALIEQAAALPEEERAALLAKLAGTLTSPAAPEGTVDDDGPPALPTPDPLAAPEGAPDEDGPSIDELAFLQAERLQASRKGLQ